MGQDERGADEMTSELIDRETLAELLEGGCEWTIEWCGNGKIERGVGPGLPDHVLQHVPTRAKLNKLKRHGFGISHRTFFMATVAVDPAGRSRVRLTEGSLSF